MSSWKVRNDTDRFGVSSFPSNVRFPRFSPKQCNKSISCLSKDPSKYPLQFQKIVDCKVASYCIESIGWANRQKHSETF